MMRDKVEILRVVERARIELLYTRSILRTCMDDKELGNDVRPMLSRCSEAITEAELLIAKIRPSGGLGGDSHL